MSFKIRTENSIHQLKKQLTGSQLRTIQPTLNECYFVQSSRFFNEYNVKDINLLGKGANGIVFRLECKEEEDSPMKQRSVAVKVMKMSNGVTFDKEFFWAQYCQLFQHPNIVNISKVWIEYPSDNLFDNLACSFDKQPFNLLMTKEEEEEEMSSDEALKTTGKFYRFYEMELCTEGTFYEFCVQMSKNPDPKRIVKAIQDILSALGYLYTLDIYPKDILTNPGNILVTRDPKTGEFLFKLADFGCVNYAPEDEEQREDWKEDEKCWLQNYLLPLTHDYQCAKEKLKKHFTTSRCIDDLANCLDFDAMPTPNASREVFQKFLHHYRDLHPFSNITEPNKDQKCCHLQSVVQVAQQPVQEESGQLNDETIERACKRGQVEFLKQNKIHLTDRQLALFLCNNYNLINENSVYFSSKKELVNIWSVILKKKKPYPQAENADWATSKWELLRKRPSRAVNTQLLRLAIKSENEQLLEYILESRMAIIDTYLEEHNLHREALQTNNLAIIALVLRQYIKVGLTEQVMEIFNAKSEQLSPQFLFNDVRTPIDIACEEGHVELVKMLLQNENLILTSPEAIKEREWLESLSIQYLTLKGDFPLAIAAKRGLVKVAVLLLKDERCDINEREQATALHYAAEYGQTKVVQLFLADSRCDVNKGDQNDLTPLAIAAQNGQEEVVALLVAHPRCAINKTNKNGVTPLFIAAQNGYIDIVMMLMENENCEVNRSRVSDGASPFLMAVQNRQTEVVKFMAADYRCDINLPRMDGITPFYMAAQEGFTDQVELLLAQARCKINEVSVNGVTPLSIAVQLGHKVIVKLILDDPRCEINKCNSRGASPLLIAVAAQHVDIVQWFLADKRCDVSQA